MAKITFNHQIMTLIGLKLNEGKPARNVRLWDFNLLPVMPIAESRGKIRLLITLPSVDIEIFARQIRKFRDLLVEIKSNLVTYVISADLPFAQNRWLISEEITNIKFLSDYKDLDFARSWGLLIKEISLLANSVYVLDREDIVIYSEIISPIPGEPNYSEVLTAIQSLN